MAHDLQSLLSLQRRRTQRAQDEFARADARRGEAQAALNAAISQFETLEKTQVASRDARIRDILARPESVAGLARIRLQYEADEEALAILGQRILDANKILIARREEAAVARAEMQRQMKREKKLEAAAERVGAHEARLKDVEAEMEMER